LSKDEIEKMVREAEQQRDKDEEIVKFVSKKNQIDALLHDAKKQGAQESDIKEYQTKFDNAKVLSDLEAIEQPLQQLIQNLYQKANSAKAEPEKAEPSKKPQKDDDDVIDAEFTQS